MRVVIAGGSGMIGRHLAELLLEDGWTVDVLTRDVGRSERRLPRGVRPVQWSGRRDPDLARALDGADGVVNLAGVPLGPTPWWLPGRKGALRQSRLAATEALVGAIASLPEERRPRVLVNASGTDVYTGRDDRPADETTQPSHDFLAQLCLDWEAAARRAGQSGTRVVLVRTAFVLARDAYVMRLLALPFRLFVGGRLGSGRQWFSWIHVDDLVRIYRLALTEPAIAGPINATAPEPVQQRDLAKAMGRALHRPSWFPVPAWPLRLVMQDQATLILGSRRVIPSRALAAGYVYRYPDLDQALDDVL